MENDRGALMSGIFFSHYYLIVAKTYFDNVCGRPGRVLTFFLLSVLFDFTFFFRYRVKDPLFRQLDYLSFCCCTVANKRVSSQLLLLSSSSSSRRQVIARPDWGTFSDEMHFNITLLAHVRSSSVSEIIQSPITLKLNLSNITLIKHLLFNKCLYFFSQFFTRLVCN